MTNPSMTKVHHYNRLSSGPCYYFISIRTGNRLAFRANEIASVRPGPFGTGVVTTVGGYEFGVTSTRAETVS
jgi:hypothetical protein